MSHLPPPPASVFDADLIRRYDGHGPRYTSYPTAAQFHAGFDSLAYRRAALLSNEAPARPLSAYVHIPFCTSPCFYCGCTKIVTRDPRHGNEYLQRLSREIELQGGLFDGRRPVRQLHFGGGTPTFLSVAQIARIVDELGRRFLLDGSQQRELSIEIDPRTIADDTLGALAGIGFNRLSLGVQDFDPHVQRAVNRRQSVERVQACVDQARSASFRSINFDLIYGLPLQTLPSFSRTLDIVIAMRPDRIAAYGYAHMPRMFKPQRAISTEQLPDAETRLQLLALTVERLTQAGYIHIGMDHFALPHDELSIALREGHLHRNFQGYSTLADCDLIGLGVSAIGSLRHSYAQNCKQLRDYYRALDAGSLPIERGIALSVDDRARRDVIQRIMCNGVVSYAEVGARYAFDFRSRFAAELQQLAPLEADGLVLRSADALTLTDKGRFLPRAVAMMFDTYLKPQPTQAYSRVI